jgi:hypothetical protein
VFYLKMKGDYHRLGSGMLCYFVYSWIHIICNNNS